MMNLKAISALLCAAALLAQGRTALANTPVDVIYTFAAIPGNESAADPAANWTTDPYTNSVGDVPTLAGVTFSPFSLEDPNTRLGQLQLTPGAFTYGRGIGQTFVVTITPDPGETLNLFQITFDSVYSVVFDGTNDHAGFPNFGPDGSVWFGFQVGAKLGAPDLSGATHLEAPRIGSGLGGTLDISGAYPMTRRAWRDGTTPPYLSPVDTFNLCFGETGDLKLDLTDPLFSGLTNSITFAIYKPYGDTKNQGEWTAPYYPAIGIDNFRIRGSLGPPPPTIVNALATNITTSSADLVGTLAYTNGDVIVFWDIEPRGQTFTWAYSNSPLALFADTLAGTTITNPISGLAPGTQYYFIFYSTNTANGSSWSAPASFSTRYEGRYTWTNTDDGAVGNWTDTANWYPASGAPGYPGQTAGNIAWLTNSASGSYTSVVDATVADSLAGLTLSNPDPGGQAWLVVSNAMLSVTGLNSLALGPGARLKIDTGGVVSNSAELTSFSGGATVYLNSLGQLYSSGCRLDATPGYTGTVMGATSTGGLWNLGGGGMAVGNGRQNDNALTLNNVTVTNCSELTSGWGYWGMHYGNEWGGNRMTLTNGVDVTLNGASGSGNIWVGMGMRSNSLTVAGSTVRSFGSDRNIIVGQDADYGGAGNALTVCSGSVLTNFASCYLGGGKNTGSVSDDNGLTVRDGGKLYLTGSLYCGWRAGGGRAGGYNTVQVSGSGSVLSLAGSVVISQEGDRGLGNRLIVTHGAHLFSGGNSTIGNGNVSNGVVVAGQGSLWDLGGKDLSIGPSAGNSLTIADGGTVAHAARVSVADAGCRITLADGALWATNGLAIAPGGWADFTTNSTATVYLLRGTAGGAIDTVEDVYDAITSVPARITHGGLRSGLLRFAVREATIGAATYVVIELAAQPMLMIIR